VLPIIWSSIISKSRHAPPFALSCLLNSLPDSSVSALTSRRSQGALDLATSSAHLSEKTVWRGKRVLRGRKSGSQEERKQSLLLFHVSSSTPSGKIERKLTKLKGIEHATINHLTHVVGVDYDPREITADKIRAFLTTLKPHTSHYDVENHTEG
jgi:hypothetical protein